MQLQKQSSMSDMYTEDQDQELLTSSLIALTSHFAQMQLRVTQIVESPAEERDALLKNLEEFAFRGIPEDLGSTLPTAALLEKQRIIIDELKNKINLKFNELDYPQLTPEDLRKDVGTALGEFVGPLKMKEKLVTQLKTQIVDLERFIDFLQDDNPRLKKNLANKTHQNCDCNGDRKPTGETAGKLKWNFRRRADKGTNSSTEAANRVVQSMNSDEASGSAHENIPAESLNDRAYNIMQKAQTIMQMIGISHLGCGVGSFRKNTLKKTYGNHWG
jgi:RUN domain-containing protein 1